MLVAKIPLCTDHRGRSRQVSPVAIARRDFQQPSAPRKPRTLIDPTLTRSLEYQIYHTDRPDPVLNSSQYGDHSPRDRGAKCRELSPAYASQSEKQSHCEIINIHNIRIRHRFPTRRSLPLSYAALYTQSEPQQKVEVSPAPLLYDAMVMPRRKLPRLDIPRLPSVVRAPRNRDRPPLHIVPTTPTVSSFAVVVSAQDVLSALRGPLFPVSEMERDEIECKTNGYAASSRSSMLKESREAELLAQLLEIGSQCSQAEKRLRGKRSLPRRTYVCTLCAKAASASSSLSQNSWLSFNRLKTWNTSFHASLTVSSSLPPTANWFQLATSITSSWGASLCCSCLSASPVSLEHAPLPVSREKPPIQCRVSKCDGSKHDDLSSVSSVTKRIVDLAKEFHGVYIRGLTIASRPRISTHWDDLISPTSSSSNQVTLSEKRGTLPQGYRAPKADVAEFLEAYKYACGDSSSCVYIPLSDRTSFDKKRQTHLPDTLPYPIVFKPQIPPFPSPLRRAARLSYSRSHGGTLLDARTTHPQVLSSLLPSLPSLSPSTPRIRLVPNPVHLKLKALRNTTKLKRIAWEGRAPDGTLGSGSEKLPGLTYDEVRPSPLGRHSMIIGY